MGAGRPGGELEHLVEVVEAVSPLDLVLVVAGLGAGNSGGGRGGGGRRGGQAGSVVVAAILREVRLGPGVVKVRVSPSEEARGRGGTAGRYFCPVVSPAESLGKTAAGNGGGGRV